MIVIQEYIPGLNADKSGYEKKNQKGKRMKLNQVITLNNDSTATIMSLKDICDLVEYALGSELAELLNSIFLQCEANEMYVKERLQTDLDAYESQLSLYHDMLLEVSEVLSEMSNQMLSGKRINKNNLADILISLSNKISLNL